MAKDPLRPHKGYIYGVIKRVCKDRGNYPGVTYHVEWETGKVFNQLWYTVIPANKKQTP